MKTELITLAEAGERLGLTDRRVAQLADALGYQNRVGGSRYLTPAQLRAIQRKHSKCRSYVKKSKGI